MENVLILYGKDYESEKAQIEEQYESNPIYVLNDESTQLDQYLDELSEEYDVAPDILFRLRLCKELFFPEEECSDCDAATRRHNVTLKQGEREVFPATMSELLRALDKNQKAQIIVENDDSTLLANILQQFVYINYPVTNLNMTLRREFKDAEKTDRFLLRLKELHKEAQSAVSMIQQLGTIQKIAELGSNTDSDTDKETKTDGDSREIDIDKKICGIYNEATRVYQIINGEIARAETIEMKVAAVASKKTGKSVIINSMIGMELAPTSLKLATPNTCIYRASRDGNFHVKYDQKDYTDDDNLHTREAIYKWVSREFRKAQDKGETGYAIPDMEIDYVSGNQDFELFTIYDTPGPDAAGTSHAENAEKYMKDSDVAIFAIDYTKYLTDGEVEYLRKVKDYFAENEKFHSLIFTVNKMDCVLQDKGGRSRVGVIDFIRNRLRSIDPKYSDCVIFGTSALDYFYCLEIETAAQAGQPWREQLAPLLAADADFYDPEYGVRAVKSNLKKAGCKDSRLINILSNIDGEVGRMHDDLGYTRINLQTIKDYSGMPQLMSYVSYIAKSKAREEIINHITHTIDTQRISLRSILNYVATVEKMIGADEDKIAQIEAILDEYERAISPLFQDNITEEEAKSKIFSDAALRASVNQAAKNEGFPIALGSVTGWIQGKMKITTPKEMQTSIWERYQIEQTVYAKRLKGRVINEDELERNFLLPFEQTKEIIRGYRSTLRRKYLEGDSATGDIGANKRVEIVQTALQNLQNERLEKINACSKEYQNKLNKSDIPLKLPETLSFDVVIEQPDLPDTDLKESDFQFPENLKQAFKKYDPVRNFFHHLFTDWQFRRQSGEITLDDKKIENAVESLKGNFILAVSDVYPDVLADQENLESSIAITGENIHRQFTVISNQCSRNIRDFRSAIDDSDYYAEHIDELYRLKDFIGQIENASGGFMTLWNEIINPVNGEK